MQLVPLHFGDQREVSLGALAEALRFECQEKAVVIDFGAVLPICRACFSGTESVSVLNFGEVFSLASVSETMQSLSKRANAMSHLFAVRVYAYEARAEDKGIDAGFLMCRTTDCLHVLRSLIMKHALTLGDEKDSDDDEFDFDGGGDGGGGGNTKAPAAPAEEENANGGAASSSQSPPREAKIDALPPEVQFLARGAFTFFLDGCDVRVRRKQERGMEGLEYLSRVGVVRNDDLPESMRPAASKRAARNSRSKAARGEVMDDEDTAYETGSTGTSAEEDEMGRVA